MVVADDIRYHDAASFHMLAQAADDDERLELIEGEVVQMPKPGFLHGRIVFELSLRIANYAREQGLGIVLAAETGFILERRDDGRDTVRGLDVAFIRQDRLPEQLPTGFVPFAPDLAVEVISPGNQAEDIHQKTLQLLRAGTSLIWLVYPSTRTVDVRQASGAVTLAAGETLSGGDVLPGFTLPVADVFSVVD